MRALITMPLVMFLLSPVQAQYSGGSGTTEGPYQIATAADLITLGETPEDYDKHFILTADIDLDPNRPSGKVFRKAVIAPDTDPNTYGFQGTPFTGVLDGNGRTIARLTIVGGGHIGLLGQLASGAEVKDLGVVDADVLGSGYSVGILAGGNRGTVSQCHSTGMVDGNGQVGGLVGNNGGGTVTHCHSTGTVSGHVSIGGLVGYSGKGCITSSYSTGMVSGNSEIGGLIGSHYGTVIRQCYSSGTVRGTDWAVGGLVGVNGGSVLYCHSTSPSDGRESVGGLMGYNWGTVAYCYSNGTVSGIKRAVEGLPEGDVGGLIGTNGGSVLYCHSTGTVSGADQCVGGLVGGNLGRVLCCYSTSPSNGEDSVGGLVGRNSGSVARSHSSGAISGTNWAVGGLVGANEATVLNCYSASATNGNDAVGGLVGHNGGEVTYCHSTGTVNGTGKVGGLMASNDGAVTQCFWDIPSSGQAASAGGTGLTTTQMQTASVFLDAGWDFLDEVANGAEDIWWIAEGLDYPKLVDQFAAFSPDPCDGTAGIIQPVVLCWVPGASAVYNDVYLGEDKDAVAEATTESAGIYRGRQPVERTTYDPGILETSKTYYWRIDEVNESDPNSPWRGKIWDFTTADFIIVLVIDDFESYTDNLDTPFIWQVWIDGLINGTGSTVGYFEAPFTEQTIVHGGGQSMPLDYNNVIPPYYSEAELPLESAQDWTIDGADTLTLYFHGRPDNVPDSLYAGIEDRAGQAAVVSHPDRDALVVAEWQRWDISLADLQPAGVNLTSVEKLYLGVGDRDNPQAGGIGLVYVDDIWVTKRMP